MWRRGMRWMLGALLAPSSDLPYEALVASPVDREIV